MRVIDLSEDKKYVFFPWAYLISSPCYRMLFFRYMFLIATGVYAYKGFKLSRVASLIMTMIGFAFVSLITYCGYEPRVLNHDWMATNLISSMLIIPFVIHVLQDLKIRFLPLEIVGRASYHIFCVQMVYYAGYYTIIQDKTATWYTHFLAGVIISIGIGVFFYYIDRPIQNLIRRVIRG